jgi:hypothetical protein
MRKSFGAMQDLKDRLEKLRTDAEDCFLLSKLATDKAKRETFAHLAAQLRRMALEVEAVIASKIAGGEA